jgi:hypothetical protein
MAPMTAEELVKHPEFNYTVWDLKPTKKGKLSVAKDRGGPIDIAYEVHGTGDRHLVVSLRYIWHHKLRPCISKSVAAFVIHILASCMHAAKLSVDYRAWRFVSVAWIVSQHHLCVSSSCIIRPYYFSFSSSVDELRSYPNRIIIMHPGKFQHIILTRCSG